MINFNNYIILNKKAWNKRTSIHIDSDFYNNERFKNGESSLKSIELNELGNVEGKSLLHLQCHFGQDSISLARMGAKVTAVDFSDVAINEAIRLSQLIQVPVDFIESDVSDFNIDKKFDIIFSSYGTIGWLPELSKWAMTISRHLKKGGLFLLTEFHPFIALLDKKKYDYFYNQYPDQEIKYGSYTDGGKDILIKDCWWNHSLTDIFSSLELNGLKLQSFREFDYSPYLLEGMTQREIGEYVLEDRETQKLPYVFCLKATRK